MCFFVAFLLTMDLIVACNVGLIIIIAVPGRPNQPSQQQQQPQPGYRAPLPPPPEDISLPPPPTDSDPFAESLTGKIKWRRSKAFSGPMPNLEQYAQSEGWE
jgi:hypothetical protein